MSSSATSQSGSASSSASTVIRSYLTSLLISHMFLSLLIPLTISLFYFSTPQSRCRPIFVLNVVAIFLAFAVTVLSDIVEVHYILEPLKEWPFAISLVIGFVGVWQSIIVDLTLLVRLISVYPSSQIGQIPFYFLITIPIILKLARAINLVLFITALIKALNGPDPQLMAAIVFMTRPYLKIEWAAQMIDNTYVSLGFLWKIRDQSDKKIMAHSSRGTMVQRLHTLFRIALGNFVVPTVVSIVQFICVYRNVHNIVINQLMLINTMMSTIGVVFATVWAGSTSFQDAQKLESKQDNDVSRLTPIFAVPPRTSNHPMSITIASSSYTSYEKGGDSV